MTQILTIEQVADVIIQSRNLTQQLFGVVLDAAGQNIIHFGSGTYLTFVNGDWFHMGMSIFILGGTITFAYRLVRNNGLRSIRHFFNF